MLRTLCTFATLLLISATTHAEMEQIATSCEREFCFYWWPKLPEVKGWHHDHDQSLSYGINAQAPDGYTFANAKTVIYAKAPYKPRMPETKTLEMLISDDKRQFLLDYPGIQIKEVKSLITADGQVLRSFAFSPKTKGNWEQVSYGEEDDFYLIFTISSRSKEAFAAMYPDYKRFINNYKKNP
jgi:hypothetical protein